MQCCAVSWGPACGGGLALVVSPGHAPTFQGALSSLPAVCVLQSIVLHILLVSAYFQKGGGRGDLAPSGEVMVVLVLSGCQGCDRVEVVI
jgi:hypothetical protein